MVTIANQSKLLIAKGVPNFGSAPDNETPAARTARILAAWRALDYDNVDNVIAIPEFGGTRSTITFNSVTNGVTQKSGNIARVQATFDVADNFDDAGQTKLREAFADNDVYSIMVSYIGDDGTLEAGTEQFCSGTVSKSTPSGNFDGAIQRQFTFNVQGDVFEAKTTPPTP